MMPDTIEMLKSIANRGEESPYMEEAAEWLADMLSKMPIGVEGCTSRQLYAVIQREAPVTSKLLSQALWRLRNSGAIDGLFTQDNRRRYMGHPLVMWKRPDRPQAVDEAIF